MSQYKGKERRKMGRRREDRKVARMMRTVILDIPLSEFMCKFLDRKRSGISIWKCIKMTKVLS